MPRLVNNFDGGPNGLTIDETNSGQYGNNPFDLVDNAGTNLICRFAASTDLATAEYTMETGTGATALTPHVEWNAAMGTQSTIWTRWYAKFSAIPTSGNNDNNLFWVQSGTLHCVSVWISNTPTSARGKPEIIDSPGGTPGRMSYQITAGTWNRFEFTVTLSPTAGSCELRLYAYPNENGDVPTETLILSSQNFGDTSADSFRLGCSNPLSNQSSTFHSNWELNTTGWPGPAPFRQGKGVPAMALTNPIAPHTFPNG